MREFDPDEVARLETAMWRSYYEKQRVSLFNQLAELLRTQYHMTPIKSTQVGRGMRSEKIRTYNFPQDRLTDHRINKSWHNLPVLMSGEIDEVIKDVTANEQQISS